MINDPRKIPHFSIKRIAKENLIFGAIQKLRKDQ
jgi:hypothetical protein